MQVVAHHSLIKVYGVGSGQARVSHKTHVQLVQLLGYAPSLHHHQVECERENAPIKERLMVVDDLLASNRKQLDRLLDLYLSGEFPRDVLTDRKTRLEATIGGLQRERAGLVAALEARTMTEDQVQDILSFARRIALGLEAADHDFEAKRQIVELLDVQATLAVEDGVKVAQVRWLLSRFTRDPSINEVYTRLNRKMGDIPSLITSSFGQRPSQ